MNLVFVRLLGAIFDNLGTLFGQCRFGIFQGLVNQLVGVTFSLWVFVAVVGGLVAIKTPVMLSILAFNNIFLSLVWLKITLTDLTLLRFWRNCQLIPCVEGIRSRKGKKLQYTI